MNMKVGVLGIPYDANSSFAKGASQAPAAIFEVIDKGSLNKTSENGILLEWGANITKLPNVAIKSPDDFVDGIECAVKSALKDGYKVLSLGGDHSVTYPIIRAFHAHYGAVNIVHFDAHPDLYNEFKGNRYSNACPFARIMEEGLAKSLHQFGIRTMNAHQAQQAAKYGVKVNTMLNWPTQPPHLEGPIYISIDIDALDPAFAPGVSHREPGGLTTRDIINFIHALKGNVIGVDIVEYNPQKDIDNMTAYVGAKLVKEAAGKLLSN
jgi:agmatinase